jgi:hypothetical protein
MSNAMRVFVGGLLLCTDAACGQTGIRRAALTSETNLPRPSRIPVYDFAVSEQEVKEYQASCASNRPSKTLPNGSA